MYWHEAQFVELVSCVSLDVDRQLGNNNLSR